MIIESHELRNQIRRIEHTPFLRKEISLDRLCEDYDRQIFKRFFPLTKHFALSGMAYVARICEKIERSDDRTGVDLEDFLCQILTISAGEFSGLTVQGTDMLLTGFRREAIHYKPSPSASGSPKCCSGEGGSLIEHIRNTPNLGDRHDRLSSLLDRVPATFQ